MGLRNSSSSENSSNWEFRRGYFGGGWCGGGW